jgi:hypothetical protein
MSANENGPAGENVMHPISLSLCHTSRRSRLDFENCLVLTIGWVVALAVTWT